MLFIYSLPPPPSLKLEPYYCIIYLYYGCVIKNKGFTNYQKAITLISIIPHVLKPGVAGIVLHAALLLHQ